MSENDHKLKLAVARMLQELLEIKQEDGVYWKSRAIAPAVLETEWLYIVAMVEQGLTAAESYTYYQTVRISIAGDLNDNSETCHGLPCDDMTFVKATFNQRAQALCKVKGVEP